MTTFTPTKQTPLLSWLAFLAFWQLIAAFFPPVILPGPIETITTLTNLLQHGDFYHHFWMTTWRGILGFLATLFLGTVVGIWMGWKRRVYDFLQPLVLLFLNLPPIAWIALLLVWFGLGNGAPILVILATTTPLVAVNVAQGVREFDPTLLEMARAFQLSRKKILRDLLLPALNGRIFAAALLALGFTWRSLVMAEFLGSTSGLGYRLSWARQNLDTDKMLAYLIVIVLLSTTIEHLLHAIYQRTRRWENGTHPQSNHSLHRHGDKAHAHPPLPSSGERA